MTASNSLQVLLSANPYLASPSYTPSLGTNLEGLSYYSTALPLLDLMKASSGFFAESASVYDTGSQLKLDAHGYVTSIPTNANYDRVGIDLLNSNSAAPPNTDYVVLYQGQGTITGMAGTTVISSQPGELIVQSAKDGSLQLQITSTDPNHTGNYIRDMHVVQESQLPLYEAGLSFNPAFIAKIDNFSTIRTMELMATNQVFDESGNPIPWSSTVGGANIANAPQLTWADRPTMNEATWSHGVPVEALVQAANLAGTDLWVNMPINASDDYIKQFATYVKANLDPGLKVHVELSNEVWNWAFPQAYYAQGQAEKLYGNGNDWMQWYGMRAAQMGAIWKDTFGEPETGADANGHVSIVIGAQLENPGLELQALNAPVGTTGNIAANYINEYAVTGYYGGFLSNDSEVATVKAWMAQPDGGYTSAINALTASIQTYNTPLYQSAAAQAKAYGLKLVTYESGFGAQTPQSEINDLAYTTFLEKLQNDPRIYSIEQQNYAAFTAAGGTLYNNFDAIAAASKFGSWGALTSITESTSPRYQALTDWNQAHAATSSDAVTYQNARIYQAGDAGETIAGTLHGYDVLVGGAGNDTFVPYGSGSTMDGMAGFNTVMLPGALSDYTFTPQADGSTVVSGYGENFTVRNIQKFIGSDGAIGGSASITNPITASPPSSPSVAAPHPATTVGVSSPASSIVTSLVASGSGIAAGSGDLHAGAVVTLTANLNEAVTVSGGTPTLLLNDGGVATYTGGSGSNVLTFNYSVASGQNTADLAVTAMQLNGASVATGVPTVPAGSGQSLTDANGHVFSFGGVSSGSDHFILRDGLVDGIGVTLALVNGTVWDHTSSVGWYADHSSSWVYQSSAPSLSAGVADLSGVVTNPAGVLQIDTTALVVSSAAPTSGSGTSSASIVTSLVASGSGIAAGSGDLHAGAVVTLTANLNEAVTVSGGTPTLLLNDGGVATYTGGSGSNVLAFNYSVASGQNTADLAVTAMQLNGASVATGVPTVAAGSGQSLTDANGHVFSFGGVSSGSDHLILRDGLVDGIGATLALVNGTVWDHTSSVGWYADHSSSWVYQSSAPSLSAGVADLSGVVTNPAGVLQIDTTALVVSSAAPTSGSGTSSASIVTSFVASGSGIAAGSGDLHAGAVVTLTANLNEAVTVSGGTPTLLLNDGGVATYTGGSGSNVLAFNYSVASGQNTADLAVTAMQLNGASVATGVPTVAAGSGQSLADANGHVFSFGGVSSGSDHFILRDGLVDGIGATLALVNGTVWDHTSSVGWYADHFGSWAYQAAPPPAVLSHVADLSGVVTNLTGIVQIHTDLHV